MRIVRTGTGTFLFHFFLVATRVDEINIIDIGPELRKIESEYDEIRHHEAGTRIWWGRLVGSNDGELLAFANAPITGG